VQDINDETLSEYLTREHGDWHPEVGILESVPTLEESDMYFYDSDGNLLRGLDDDSDTAGDSYDESDFDSDAPTGRFGEDINDRLDPIEASDFVDTLKKLDIASIAPEDIACGVCLDDFQVATPHTDHTPVETPRCHQPFGRECLLQALKNDCARCPMCRQDLLVPLGIRHRPTRTSPGQ